jgi:hypothetical protein
VSCGNDIVSNIIILFLLFLFSSIISYISFSEKVYLAYPLCHFVLKRRADKPRDRRHSCGSYDDVFNLDVDVCVVPLADSSFASALNGFHHPHPDTESYKYS